MLLSGNNVFNYTYSPIKPGGIRKPVLSQPTKNYEGSKKDISWLDKNIMLCRNYEPMLEPSENMVKLAAIKLLLNGPKYHLIIL
jgi:hypothetical protein